MARKSRAERARQAAAFRRGLLRWYRRHGRDLPWRRTRDPYRIVVSEFMLQQTQVSRVEAYYQRFLARYPTIHALAAAPAAAVRESWEGLGYYRRATNLHRLAQAVVDQHAGVLPSDPAALERLPGVGRYTAGAVACFAYERVAATVDTNVARVIRRVFHPRLGRKALPTAGLGDGAGDSPATRQARVGGESSADGARSPDLYGESGEMRRLPCAKGVLHRQKCHPERSEGDIAAA